MSVIWLLGKAYEMTDATFSAAGHNSDKSYDHAQDLLREFTPSPEADFNVYDSQRGSVVLRMHVGEYCAFLKQALDHVAIHKYVTAYLLYGDSEAWCCGKVRWFNAELFEFFKVDPSGDAYSVEVSQTDIAVNAELQDMRTLLESELFDIDVMRAASLAEVPDA